MPEPNTISEILNLTDPEHGILVTAAIAHRVNNIVHFEQRDFFQLLWIVGKAHCGLMKRE
jgi:hypothetical protein